MIKGENSLLNTETPSSGSLVLKDSASAPHLDIDAPSTGIYPFACFLLISITKSSTPHAAMVSTKQENVTNMTNLIDSETPLNDEWRRYGKYLMKKINKFETDFEEINNETITVNGFRRRERNC